MPRFCTNCGAQVEDNAGFCPSCGKPVNQSATNMLATPASPAAGGLTDNVAGLLAYITIIPAIIFLVLEPYNRKLFVRFHSFQCIFFTVAWIALWLVLTILGSIPVVGYLTLLLMPIIGIAGTVLWIILLVKAYQGQMFKLPVIGDMAEKQARAV